MLGVSAESHLCYDHVNWHERAGEGTKPLTVARFDHAFEVAEFGPAQPLDRRGDPARPDGTCDAPVGPAQPALRSLPGLGFGDLAEVEAGGVNRLLAPDLLALADLEAEPEPPPVSLACLRFVWSR